MDPEPIQGNIRPNWGAGRNLRIEIFEEETHTDMMAVVNAWFAGLDQEKILKIELEIAIYGTPEEESYHVMVTYTES